MSAENSTPFIGHRFRIKKLANCYGCGKLYRKENMTQLCDDDPESNFCPTCAFVMALYIQSGLRTVFTRNSLSLHLINKQFRKAAMEFNENPKAAEEKYLEKFRGMQEEQKKRLQLTDKKIRQLDQFPFVFMTPEEYQYHAPKQGKEFVLYGETLELKRKVYHVQELKEEDSVRYGHNGVNYVCYFPEIF